MLGMKFNDPQKIVTDMITTYARSELSRPRPSITAESMGHMLAGMRIARYYRVDMTENGRNLMARQFLRGVLTDDAV